MQYAVNTSFNVIQTGEGLLFVLPGRVVRRRAAATGPWTLATDACPPVIYTIPPSSPMYPCTYVRVYAATPDDRDLRLHRPATR